MKKIQSGVYTFFVPSNLQRTALEEYLTSRMKFLNHRRQLIMRKSDGTETHLGTGVRLHGKRHTS